jgi:hypothetical protein
MTQNMDVCTLMSNLKKETTKMKIDPTIGCGPEIVPGKEVAIHYNDEGGSDNRIYSVEYMDDPGNWIDSFKLKKDALKFIKDNGLKYKKDNFYSGLIEDSGWKK